MSRVSQIECVKIMTNDIVYFKLYQKSDFNWYVFLQLTHTYTNTDIYTHTHTYTYIHTHKQIHTHTLIIEVVQQFSLDTSTTRSHYDGPPDSCEEITSR